LESEIELEIATLQIGRLANADRCQPNFDWGVIQE